MFEVTSRHLAANNYGNISRRPARLAALICRSLLVGIVLNGENQGKL